MILGLSVLTTLNAAYIPDKVLFEENFPNQEALNRWGVAGAKPQLIRNGGPDGKTNAVKFHIPRMGGNSYITMKIDPAKVKGLILFEAMVRGENLEMGKRSFLGPKFMLAHGTAKQMKHPEPDREFGTYGWKRIRKYYEIAPNTDRMTLWTGIQEGKGSFYVANIRICQAKAVSAAEAAKQTKAPFNKKAAKIPRGSFKGSAYRGVMSGHDLSPEAFAELGKWGANLIRYQFNPKRGEKIDTKEKYLAFIDRKIGELDAILPLAKKYGIKIAIDLHTGPGTVKNKVASNILASSTSLETLEETWRKIAKHYKGNPQIYGYDLLNEPVAETYAKGKKNPWEHMVTRMVKAIREIDPDTPVIVAWHQSEPFLINDKHVIYTPHYYSPHSYTHQGVLSTLKWSYPGDIDGIYWDKEQIRLNLKSLIEFQKKHNVKIFVGEFGCIVWVPSGREQYIKDCIELFEEYGWDWAYHAFREWDGWSAEHVSRNGKLIKEVSPTQRVLMNAMKKKNR